MSNRVLEKFSLFSSAEPGIESWISRGTDPRILSRIEALDQEPLSHSQLIQLLLLGREAGLSQGFFKYYWLHVPAQHAHPYRVESLPGYSPDYKDRKTIRSVEHLHWGMYRLYVDALLFFGNVRQAYRELRQRSFEELEAFFELRCFDYASPSGLLQRGPALPLEEIAKDDRYLISEQACKSFEPLTKDATDMLAELQASYRRLSGKNRKTLKIKELIEGSTQKERQGEFEFSASEFIEDQVGSLQAIKSKYGRFKARFDKAREQAVRNTDAYLSLVNDLDVYVATSMRSREDFRRMATNCEAIFQSELLAPLNLRYFDPTLSAASGHVDKGLIECLMVKCAKMLVYMAGERESYGKDAEAAMALSLGKPVIFHCETEAKARFYKDIHPLTRLIDFSTGVAVGAYVTSSLDQVTLLISRILSNSMQYELVKPKDNYLELREKVTGCTVRVQTNNLLLRETFWNHYHNRV